VSLPHIAQCENSGETGGQFVILNELMRSRAVPTIWGSLYGGGASDATFGGCLHCKQRAVWFLSHFPASTSFCGQGTYDDDWQIYTSQGTQPVARSNRIATPQNKTTLEEFEYHGQACRMTANTLDWWLRKTRGMTVD
jgi:hypothetical protein